MPDAIIGGVVGAQTSGSGATASARQASVPTRIDLVCDDQREMITIQRLLGDREFQICHRSMAEMLASMPQVPDCILVCHDARTIDALRLLTSLRGAHDTLPCALVVLGDGTDAKLAKEAIKHGALDYLAREGLDREMLEASIRTAIVDFQSRALVTNRARERAHLAALVAASSDAIVGLAADGRRVLSWSAGAVRLFGYSESEAVGKTIDELIIPEFKNSERTQIFEATSQGESLVVETERHDKLGKLIAVEINVSPMPMGYSVIFRDIRERRRIEREMQRSQDRLAAREAELTRAQRIARIGSYEVECKDGKFINRRSPEYLAIHGLPSHAWNEPHEDWVQRMHPDDRALSEHSFKTAMVEGVTEYEAEYRIIRPSDGETRWIKVLAEIDRDERGNPSRLFGTHIDITDRKRAEEGLKASEERLRLATQAARLGLFEIDWKSNRRHWSKELRDLIAVPEDVDISDDADLLHRVITSESQERFRQRLAASLDPDGSREYEDEHEIVRMDGSRRFVLIRGRTLFEDSLQGPRPTRSVGLMMDITERKKAERQRELLLRELDHRLKNVFATVSSMIGMTARSASSVADYAASLRDRLYALSAVHNLVRGADLDNTASLAMITRTITTGGLRDKIVVNGPEVIVTAAMAIALGMILNELLTNAIKYGALAREGGVVELTWSVQEQDLLLRWQEMGGPAVVKSGKTGFGTRMIEQNVAVMGGSLDFEWRTGGVVVTLVCPMLGSGQG